jgi:glycosyltransferase involved in cell wall biosynthesis
MSGGVRVAAIYAKALADQGHRVCLVSPPRMAIPLRRKIKSFFKGNGWPSLPPQVSHLDSLDLDHRVIERYRPVMDLDVPDADIVIATWWETAEWVNALGREKGVKVHFIQHHEIFDYLPVERCKATYRMPLHKIVIARWLADVMRDEYGDADVDLVPNSVDHNQFHASARSRQDRPTIGFLFHDAHFKGMDLVLAALHKLRGIYPGLRAISFGSKRPRSILLPDWIEFSLFPPQEKIREIYAQCDVWLTASRSEGFNLPAMEAMACRTPVVSTRTGWPEESIQNGKNGFLVDVDDVDALAGAAERVLGLPDESWREMSSQAYATVAGSSWENSARMFVEALEHGIQRARREEVASGVGHG